MNILTSTAVVIGLLIGIILVVLFFKIANRDHKVKTEYDERQQNLRNKAYRYSFFAIAGYEVVMACLSIANLELPAEPFIIHFGAIFFGCMVQIIYSIMNDVYWGLNNDRKRYYAIFAFCLILNALPIVGSLRTGGMVVDGKLSTPFLNVLCEILILVALIVLFIKSRMDLKEDSEEA